MCCVHPAEWEAGLGLQCMALGTEMPFSLQSISNLVLGVPNEFGYL